MRKSLFALYLALGWLLAGCQHATVPAPPPPPALAQVTFAWTPAPNPCDWLAGPCLMAQQLYCEGQTQKQPYTLESHVSRYTIALPEGPTLCSLSETVSAQTWYWTDFDALWEGTVRPGNQTVALRLGTGW